MNHTSLILILFSSIAGILLFAIWSNAYVYAQQTSSTSPSSASMPSSPSVAKIKITSPTKGQQVPVGKDLTVSGTSIDNAASNYCKVSVIVNKVRPYQPATATGTGGAADYSKWKFDITSKYTTIKPGQNRITAKYECGNNAALTSFSSVNVIGVPSLTPLQNPKPIATTIPTVSNASNKTSSSSVIAPQLNTINQQEHPPQLLPTTQVQNYTLSPTYSGMGSDKLMYLGYHHGNDSFTGKSGSSITTTKSDSSSNNHDNNGDSSSKITGNSNTESSNHNTGGGATHVQSTGKTGTIKSEISSSHDSDSTITHDSSAGKNTTTTTVGSLSHSSPNDKKNSSDTKSSAHKNDGSKTHSSTLPHSSQSNNHKNNDNKANKSSTSSPKGSDHHKSGGDSFFGGDPFFNDDDDDF